LVDGGCGVGVGVGIGAGAGFVSVRSISKEFEWRWRNDIRFLNRECASYTAADDHAHQDKFEENEQDPEVATRQAQ